ncbi:polyamine-transporting ATPase 13A3-like isoform X1 [Clytia hemisphaerica]|uniref:Cation-transporting ATPase n=2 Tax=Clytia hemisphaerica TaxID=252671 RepID=A0A7M5V5R2_9CNID
MTTPEKDVENQDEDGKKQQKAEKANPGDQEKMKLESEMTRKTDYASIQDTTCCKIEDLVEDNITTCYGYKRNCGKTFLYILGVILTAGFLWLVTYWKPDWKLYLTHSKCSLSIAQRVLLVDQFGTIFVEPVFSRQFPKEALPFRSNSTSYLSDTQNKTYTYFMYRRLKYYFDEFSERYKEAESVDDNASIHDLYQFNSSNNEIQNRQDLIKWFGPNIIDIKVTPYITLFFQECADPFYIFQALSCLLWFMDDYYYYASAIVFISLTSIIISMYQTRQHLVTLHNMISKSSEVTVLDANGQEISIHSKDLVPGDILVIPKEGCMLLCDATLISGTAIVNESMLTGESVPVTKTSLNKPLSKEESPIYNSLRFKRNTLFCGTQVLQTRYFGNEKVLAVVVKTGFTTMKGGLIRSILYPKPVDFKFISDAMKFVGVLASFAAVGLIYTLVIFYYHGATVGQMFKKALDVITIAVPPALPAAMSVGTVYALHRLKKKDIFCISPSRINISGHLNLFCFDKTGTLTEDGLDFCGIIPVCGNDFNHLQESVSQDSQDKFTIGMACCHSLTIIDGHITGDPLDLKMFEATVWDLEESGGVETERYGSMVPTIVRPKLSAVDSVRMKYLDDKSLPLEVAILKQFTFSSELQRMSVVVRKLGAPNMEIYAKGSPEMIASLSTKESLPDNFEECLMTYTRQGYRVLALAHKSLPKSVHWHKIQHYVRGQAESDLTFLGFIVMKNLLKPVTTSVINQLETANIRTVMVTGDNVLTAVSVARECNMVRAHEKIVSITQCDGNKLQYNIVGELDALEEEEKNKPILFEKMKSDFEKYSGTDYHFAVTGKVFAHIYDEEPVLFERLLVRGTIFARMLPDQKTLLVDSLQSLGYSVGMCGDGANDCGALKRANAGISLSETEASVASPFTSKTPNISCVVDVIKEGRCALVTSFNIFKYMALYSMIQYTSVLIMYWVGVNMGDFQYLYIDLFTIMPFAITMSRTEPSGVLVALRPLGRLVHPYVLFSIVIQIAIQTSFQVASYFFVQTLPYYQPMSAFKNQTHDSDGYLLAYENTILFTLTCYQYIFVALVFSVGKPFRKPFYTNILLLLSGLVLLGFTTFLATGPPKEVRDLFSLLQMKPEGSYYYVFFGLIAGNLLVSVFVEYVLMETDIMKDWLNYEDKKQLTKYQQIQKEIFHDDTWYKSLGV